MKIALKKPLQSQIVLVRKETFKNIENVECCGVLHHLTA